ncbi:MAG TPA: glycine--tRNA ligase subunit beta [Bacillota bacterium]|jgi:glycyl-tRNA synthetase beta chain|nr:glycine--tRNA ligase subunit beta [Bacillota bacterium]
MAQDLLLEIGVEEMPAKFMPGTLTQLKELAAAALEEARLDYAELRTLGAPRRIALFVQDLSPRQRDLAVKVRGPAAKAAYDAQGNPTKALLGFARGQGVEISAVIQEEVKGVPYIFAEKVEAGRPAVEVLPQLLETCLFKLSFPKSMRWGSGELRFARPVRWLLALFGQEILPLEFGGIKAGNTTRGHRFLTREPIIIDEAGQYLPKLEQAWVIADQDKRRRMISEQVAAVAAAHGAHVQEDSELLEEVTYLVEYPTALYGTIDEEYMELPAEVLITSMREHQRYFPVTDAAGKLLPGFIAVRSGTAEHLDIVRQGNEKVLRARLNDANFFWTEDQKMPLSARRGTLDRVVFLEDLGSMGDKVERIVSLTGWLADHLQEEVWVKARAQRAASLAKADLVTQMVTEFPELQGIMGEKYALAGGEEGAVARAIGEHYQPRFAGDALPGTREGLLVALADKIDNICGCFLTGLIPTGSQDPYALRRQAQGICTMALEKELSLSLSALVAEAYRLYEEQFPLAKTAEILQEECRDFFRQRLRFILGEEGISYDVIDAVVSAGIDRPAEVSKRARALTAFRQDESFGALLTVYTRAANLAQKGDGSPLREDLLTEPAEKELWASILQARQGIAAASGDYAAAFQVMANLRPAVDAFFDAVMVMVEDPDIRRARLALLGEVVALMEGIADLSKIVEG